MGRPPPQRQFPREAGFTLIEIGVVIIILGILLSMIAGIGTTMLKQQRREATRQRLAGVETALALYVSQNLRLPCPANGLLPGSDANAGLEQITPGAPSVCNVAAVANSQRHGVVPWRSLGLAELDATDGWGNRLTYRVSPDFVTAPAMNLTFCDPGGTKTPRESPLASPGGYCDPLCTTATFPASCTLPSAVTSGFGLEVRNLVGSKIMDPAAAPSTGAAYVVISHGENNKGSYSNQGVLQNPDWDPGGREDEEKKNAADLVLAAHFVDDFFVDSATVHFDDFVLRPSILTVATKAQLGPRAH